MRFGLLVVLTAVFWAALGATCVAPIGDPDNETQVGVTLGVAFSAPQTSRSVPVGTVVQVKWDATNTTGKPATLRILVEARPGLARTTLADGIAIAGAAVGETLEWDTTGFAAAEYRIIGEISNADQTKDENAAGEITIDGGPTFVFTGPATETTLPDDDPITISFTSRDPEGNGTARLGIDPDTDHSNANEIFIDEQELPEDLTPGTFDWNGESEDGEAVAVGTYNLFALVDDGVNRLLTVEGLARLIVSDENDNSNSNANGNDNDNEDVTLGIIEPAEDEEFLSTSAELNIEFGVNEPTDVLVDLKIDADDNHANGNEITILSQRLISAGVDTDSFAWNGNNAQGAAVPNGIYTLLIVVNRGAGAPETKAGDAFIFRRSGDTSPLSRQVWERAAAAWSLTVPDASPSARRDFGLAFDSLRNVTVLYGGHDGATSNAETWEWNRTIWTQRTVSGPPALDSHALAYDSQRNVAVLFGGRENGAARAQTWEWNGNAWSEKIISGPSARFDHAMAYDSNRGVVVLFGGTDGVISSRETWEYDGTTWRLAASNGPVERQGHALAFDTERRVTLLFGGSDPFGRTDETWEWDGTTWIQRTPPTKPAPRADHAMAFDATRGAVVLFGGRDASGLNDETWEWDGDAWTQAEPAARPAAREGHGLAFVSNAAQTALFGGASTIPLVALLQPAAVQTVDPGQFVNIAWRDDDPSGRATIRLTLDDDNTPDESTETDGAEIEVLSGREAAGDGVRDTFAFQIPASLDPDTYFLFAYIDSDDATPADQISTAPGRIIVRDPANP